MTKETNIINNEWHQTIIQKLQSRDTHTEQHFIYIDTQNWVKQNMSCLYHTQIILQTFTLF